MRLLPCLLLCGSLQIAFATPIADTTRTTFHPVSHTSVAELSLSFSAPSPITQTRKLRFYYNRRYRTKDLWNAIDESDFDMLEEVLLCECVYLEEKDESGQTALHRALRIPNEAMALALIEAGADVNARDTLDFTPLHLSCRHQYMNATVALLEGGADANAAMYANERPLSYVLVEDNLALTELLVSYGAEINFLDDFGDTPLHVAAMYGDIQIVQYLIERGANLTVRRRDGQTPAEHICACLEHDERELIPCAPRTCTQADIRTLQTIFRRAERRGNAVSNSGITELDLWGAVVRGTPNDVEEILDCSCTNPESGEQIPDCRCVELQAVTQFETEYWTEGQTALHLAVLRGHLAICRLLIENGARADFRNSDGNTPLHLAVRGNAIEIVEVLLDQDISADGQNDEGQTALHIASRFGYINITRILADYGAALSLNDEQGATPVELVCSCLLMEDCAEGTCRDGDDIVDIMIALGKEDEEDQQRVVQLYFSPNSATLGDGEATGSDDDDGAASLGSFVGVLFAFALVFFGLFAVRITIMKRRQMHEERMAKLAQVLDQPGPSVAHAPPSYSSTQRH